MMALLPITKNSFGYDAVTNLQLYRAMLMRIFQQLNIVNATGETGPELILITKSCTFQFLKPIV